MRAVYAEDPSYWPYGLDVGQFDGGLYLISKQANQTPVGFVGWQEREKAGRRIGYYAIGILPEHRQQGFAKQAVSAILREMAPSVDEVRAMVMEHNVPSKHLAASLGVPVEEKLRDIAKSANTGGGTPATRVAGALLGALGTVVGSDQVIDPSRPVSESFQPWEWDKRRVILGALNAVLGATGGYTLGKGNMSGFIPIGLAPTKDLALQSIGTLHKLENLVDPAAGALTNASRKSDASSVSKLPPSVLLGALGLGAGALGVAAYAAKRKADAADAARAGRVRVTLPTKDPNDAETFIDMPIEDINMSNALRSRLGRDARRRLYEETRKRTVKRKPKDPQKPTQRELEDMEISKEMEEISKESSIVSLLAEVRPTWWIKEASLAQSAVPTPPPYGVNPAQRMTQQQAVAKSIDTSTAANPQIMKAQQAAAQAESTAQQQVMQAQQESSAQMQQAQQEAAQAQMQQQQQFTEQITKVQQQNEILKLQLEKAKAQNDLEKAKNRASAEIAKERSSLDGGERNGAAGAIQELTQSRLARLRQRIQKSAASDSEIEQRITGTPGTLDPQTGAPIKPPAKVLRPNAMQRVNQDPGAVARGNVPQVGLWRTSYGPVGDWLYSSFLRGPMLTPSAVQPDGPMSAAAMLNNPDTLGMVEMAQRGAQQAMRQPMGY